MKNIKLTIGLIILFSFNIYGQLADPTDVHADNYGCGRMQLSWTPVTGATGYDIYIKYWTPTTGTQYLEQNININSGSTQSYIYPDNSNQILPIEAIFWLGIKAYNGSNNSNYGGCK